MSSQLFSSLKLNENLIPERRPSFRDDRLKAEEAAKNILFEVHQNDGSPESYEVLTGLKNVFQKQLPKMPKEYVTRLVYDRRHTSLAIVKPGRKVVAGITYRSFPERHFCEIVFCAVASTEQVKGIGAYMMCHLKELVKKQSHGQIQHFLTYADNYAIGYFKKQGFTAEVTLDRNLWAGYIKDYDGGTLMQCTMVPGIDYLDWYSIVYRQQQHLVRLIHAQTGCGRVYPGLTSFSSDPSTVPGVSAAGWTPAMSQSRSSRTRLYEVLRPFLSELQGHPASWPFRQPVDLEDVPDYATVIMHPMDLSTMDVKLESNQYNAAISLFITDFHLIISNCRTYNDADTTYCKNATLLERFFNEKIKAIQEKLQL